jgi:cytidine deaminase
MCYDRIQVTDTIIDTQSDKLIASALAARSRAYAPYSKFAVGAAIQCKSGAVFVGTNIENRSYGLTICAERVAIGSAIAAGQRDFVAIAVIADSDEPIVPCGACRQFLAEFAPDLIIVSATLSGQRKIENLSHLLPDPSRGILKHVHSR